MQRLGLTVTWVTAFLIVVFGAAPAGAAPAPVARFALSNGLQVWHLPRIESQSVAVCLTIHAGSRFEVPGQKGITHFLEHMCFEGTKRYGADQGKTIEIISALGGAWNAQTEAERTSFWAIVPANHFETAVEWVSQIAFHPTFPPEKLEKVRSVIFEEKGGKSRWLESRFFAADVTRETRRALFPGSALADPPIGETKAIGTIGLDDVVAYHRAYYQPNNAVLIVVGNVSATRVHAACTSYFADLPKGPAPVPPVEPKFPDSPPQRVVIHGWANGLQGSVLIAARTARANNPDRAVLAVLRELLRQSLLKELHFDQGLAYAIAAYDEGFTDAGYFGLFAKAKRSKLRRIEAVIQKHVEEIRKGEIDPQKVEDAKKSCSGRWTLSTEGNPGWMLWLQPMTFAYTLDDALPDVVAEVAAVTPNDLVRVVKTYFVPERTSVTIQRPPF